ncbi:MAG TPA: Xaa-Pro peptidase family protein [Candidatus Limnocylindrales bacterium]|nr:Xaa-Pro peptidase family protein [Candidatus Limnocylindrales bacterium]
MRAKHPVSQPVAVRTFLVWIVVCCLILITVESQPTDSFPPSDPALPKIDEPRQTQDPSVYRARREALMKTINEGVAVVYAEGEEDGDGYRQSSDFFYLTGVQEEKAILVLAPKERTYREFLLLANRDPEAERWTGEREPLGLALRKKYGFEKIYRTDRLLRLMLELTMRSPVLWQVVTPNPAADKKPADLELYDKVSSLLAGVTKRPLPYSLAEMRSRHSMDEIALLQRAVRITENGFRAAATEIRPGSTEARVEAEAERIWKASGARRPAYPSIVGSGPNSTILHYPKSERNIQEGELILLDMGAEFAHYAADITRTFPVSGRFTARQREIYELVLRAQKAALAKLKPGVYIEDLDAAARQVIESAGYGDYFIHGLGHFVGLDVHDAGAYQQPLAAGMVITLEPGIYIPEEKLGIRIEDDVLVTKTGAKILSDGLPRESGEIEKWLADRRARSDKP